MKCPFCDTEMLHGYLNCGTTIWSERKHKISLLPDGKEKYALHFMQPLMSPNQIESHCCPKCKRIIIDAADYENNLSLSKNDVFDQKPPSDEGTARRRRFEAVSRPR